MVEWKLGEGRHGTAAGFCGQEVSLLERCEDKGEEKAGGWQERDGRKVSLPSPVGTATPALQRAEVSRGTTLPYSPPCLKPSYGEGKSLEQQGPWEMKGRVGYESGEA